MNRDILKKIESETKLDYINRVCGLKDEFDLTWTEVAALINEELDVNYSDSWYRKNYAAKSFPAYLIEPIEDECDNSSMNATLLEIKKERIKNSDERAQTMFAVRRLAREETLVEIAKEVAEVLKSKPVLPNYNYITNTGNKSAILQISDWHYGIEINNPWNTYNPEIARDRIIKLRSRVIEKIQENSVKDLYIANLGDLISGRIHETIRIQNRIDVISQALEVAEILVEFLAYLSQYADIHYISTTDNHSRLEPKKESSLDLESLTRVIDPLLEARIQNLKYANKCKNIDFVKSPFGPDIAKFTVGEYKIGAVHGHKDNPKAIVSNISLMTQDNYDLILSAHLHHFSCDEQHNTVIVSNGSLMGTDDYASDLRLNNKPSQNLIILSEVSVVESIHKITLV